MTKYIVRYLCIPLYTYQGDDGRLDVATQRKIRGSSF